jgi:hypothetical protein
VSRNDVNAIARLEFSAYRKGHDGGLIASEKVFAVGFEVLKRINTVSIDNFRDALKAVRLQHINRGGDRMERRRRGIDIVKKSGDGGHGA